MSFTTSTWAIHNRLGKKVCEAKLPASYSLRNREPQLINHKSTDYQIGDRIKIGNHYGIIQDSMPEANPPTIFIEYE